MGSARASASRRRPKGAGRSARRKRVSYDVGRVLGMNWRPVFDPDVAREADQDFAVTFTGRSRG